MVLKEKNADYPPIEEFSDLHITFGEEGMDGFGDFLIVGDDYTEGGGPAYAVAIHLTFLESKKKMSCIFITLFQQQEIHQQTLQGNSVRHLKNSLQQ